MLSIYCILYFWHKSLVSLRTVSFKNWARQWTAESNFSNFLHFSKYFNWCETRYIWMLLNPFKVWCCLATERILQVCGLISCKLSIKVCNCHANKPRTAEGQIGWKRWLSVTCMCLTAWGYTFTYRPPLWILGRIATASIFSVHGKGGGCTWDVQQQTASAESSNEKGAPPPTSMSQLPPRWARSSLCLKVWKEVWASTFLCKSGTKQQWKH